MGGHLGGPSRHRGPTPSGVLPSAATTPTEAATSGGTPMKAADVFPDLHHKMSKKIAQLTKVIYHLNTKNEDRQDILSDAANKIKRFKEKLASKQGQLDMEAQVDKLRQAHAKEKEEALAEFRTFKRNAKAREESIQLDCKERTEDLATLVEKEKKGFEESLRRFQEKGMALRAALETAQKSAAGNVSTLKAKHKVGEARRRRSVREGGCLQCLTETNQVDFPDRYCVPRRLLISKCFGLKVELEEAVRKGNEKFNTMITDQLMAQEDIRRAAEMEAKGAKQEFEQQVGRLRAELAGDKEAALSALRRESDEELKATRKSLTEKLERALADATQSRAVCAEEKKRNASLKADRERLNGEIIKLRENATAMVETSRLEEASLRRLLENAAAEGRRLTKALEQTEAARDEALAVGRGAGGEAEGLRERLARERKEKEAFERSAVAEIASKDGEIAARLGEIAALRKKLDGALGYGKEATEKLKEELTKAQEDVRRASLRVAETEKRLRDSLDDAERTRGEGKRTVNELQRQGLEYTKQHAAAAEASLRSTMDKELDNAQQKLLGAKRQAEKDLEEAQQASAGGARELMEKSKRKEEELMRQLGEEARHFEAALERERASRVAEVNENSAKLKALRQEAAEEKKKLQQAVEQGGQEADREISRLRAQVEGLERELDERKRAHDKEKGNAERNGDEAGRLAREVNSLRGELKEARKAAADRVGEERAAAQAEARALEDRAIRETQERLRRAAAEADDALAAEVGRVSEKLKSEHDAALSEAVKAERDGAEARHAEVLRQAKVSREHGERQQEDERRALLAAHKTRLAEAEANGRAMASAMRVPVKARRSKVTHAMESRLFLFQEPREHITIVVNMKASSTTVFDEKCNTLDATPPHGNAQEKAEEKAEEDKKAFEARLQSELQAQASRSAAQLSEALSASLREKEAAVTAAVAAKALQLQATKAVADKANEALAARLEVWMKAETNEMIAAAKEETEAIREAKEAEIRNQRLATAAREAALVSKHATELSHAVGRQRDELRHFIDLLDLAKPFAAISFIVIFTAKGLHTIKLNSYENRPSREEDVKRIRQLEADAIESRNVAARAREEMAFFKRELLNREENYNKKFNANPVVGVMQVVKPMDIRGSEGSNKRTGSEARFNPAQQHKPRPPRYYQKTARSASMPSDYPSAGEGGMTKGIGGVGGRDRRHPATSDGGSVGSLASSRSNGRSSKEASRARGGRAWRERTGPEGAGSISTGGGRS
ncbi:unnamed protein product [Ectocarpus sp. CCAP 1310/34]|nr:unnamed protein product [Ectocarpus sp. CCAP 1310/34]